ncbi:ComF family protein [Duncaniella muris]|uniref:ComF family protein n=1 Tax=Duncaniella muris TaxID=2094150 RepID=UPI0023EFE18A|nr:ComF family protein [Duncaniella muris]
MIPNNSFAVAGRWLRGLVNIIFPDVCTVCHRPLVDGEDFICLQCLLDMPVTNFHKSASNSLADRLFSPSCRIEKTASTFYYRRGNPYTAIIHDTKYRNRPKVGRHFASLHAKELSDSGFFDDIDALVPVPLHFLKKIKRGYNQAEEIAKGLGHVCGLPVETPLKASWHRSQTRKDIHARLQNTIGAYSLPDPELIADRHILLVDDVITTGSTILACAQAIKKASPATRISVYSLATTQLE